MVDESNKRARVALGVVAICVGHQLVQFFIERNVDMAKPTFPDLVDKV